MDRRSFFRLAGVAGLAPLVACEGRDAQPPPDQFARELERFRTIALPENIEPALVFVPLRQPTSNR